MTITRVSPAEYLRQEAVSDEKFELIQGEVSAMAGARRAHNDVVADLGFKLGTFEREGGCRHFIGDQRVRVVGDDYYYPDVVVACDPVFDAGELDTLVNPLLVIEVLSASTEGRDRGVKSAGYRSVASLREYLLVDPDRPHVDHFRRVEEGWLLMTAEGVDAVLRLTSLKLDLPLAEIYRRRIADDWAP